MRKPRLKTTKILKEAIQIEQLPPMVPRPLACDFALLSARTFIRAEEKGLLRAFKGSSKQAPVSYRKAELLRYLGIVDEKPAPRRRRAAA